MRKASPVRVIAGSLGGRDLRAPRGDGTRPTSDKVRQAIFNILANLSPASGTAGAVLDLYAGSGALGIEALSRGASRAVFVDHAPEVIRVLTRNLADLGLGERGQIVRGEVARLLARLPGLFDLVFVDPPYRLFAEPDGDRALARLPPLLAPGAVVVVEHDRRSPPQSTIGPLSLLDRRRYGDTEVSFYR